MLPWLRILLLGVFLRPSLCATEPPPTTATPGVLTPTSSPSTTSTAVTTTAAPDYQLTEEPWFPYRELIFECLVQMSWPCAQRKMIVYLDQLNRARSVSVLGDLLTLVKVRADNVPPITEELLTARRIDQDQESLYRLLEVAADRFVDSHVLRVNVPTLEGGVLRVTPLDVNFVTAGESEQRSLARTGRGKKGGGMDKGGGKMKKKGGKMMMKMMMMAGKKMMMMMGKMVMVKMMMMVPIAMKKGMIGGMAGLMSMGMMKAMLLMKIISLIKQKLASCGGGLGGGGGGGFGGGGGGDDCGGGGGGGGYGGGGGGYGGGGGGGGWDRTYNTNNLQGYSQPYTQSYNGYNQPNVYYYQHPQEEKEWWSLWKRR